MELGPPPLFNQGVSARARLAILSLLAIALLLVDARLRALDAVRQGLEVALYPLERALLWPRDAADRLADYLSTVASLSRENADLRRATLGAGQKIQSAQQVEAENAQLRKLLGLRERVGAQSTAVEVLYESRDRFTHKFVVDRGSSDGLAAGSPVVDDLGVIGQVTRVYPLTAEVSLLTDKDQSIPVVVQRNGLRAVAYGGAEPGTMDLRFTALSADLVNGDLLVTSGIDGVYPPGLPVGRVERVERDASDEFARVVLRPVAGIERNAEVLVLAVDERGRPTPEPVKPPEPPRKGGKR